MRTEQWVKIQRQIENEFLTQKISMVLVHCLNLSCQRVSGYFVDDIPVKECDRCYSKVAVAPITLDVIGGEVKSVSFYKSIRELVKIS